MNDPIEGGTEQGSNDDDATKAGWWLASDGQWYPPETRRENPAPDVGGGARSATPALEPTAGSTTSTGRGTSLSSGAVLAGLGALAVLVLVVVLVAGVIGGGGSSESAGGGGELVTTDAGTDVQMIYDAFQADERVPDLGDPELHFTGCYPCTPGTFDETNLLTAPVDGSGDTVKITIVRDREIAKELRDSFTGRGFATTCGVVVVTVEGSSDFDGRSQRVSDVIEDLEGSC